MREPTSADAPSTPARPRTGAKPTTTLAALRAFYARGQASLRKHPGRAAYGSMAAVDAAGGSGETLRKARYCADPETGYTAAEFEALIRQCEAAGYVLGVSLVIRLLSVPKGRRRDALQ